MIMYPQKLLAGECSFLIKSIRLITSVDGGEAGFIQGTQTFCLV